MHCWQVQSTFVGVILVSRVCDRIMDVGSRFMYISYFDVIHDMVSCVVNLSDMLFIPMCQMEDDEQVHEAHSGVKQNGASKSLMNKIGLQGV